LAHQVALKFGNGSAWTIAKDILKQRFQSSSIQPLRDHARRIDLSSLYSPTKSQANPACRRKALLRLAGAEQNVLTAAEFEHARQNSRPSAAS